MKRTEIALRTPTWLAGATLAGVGMAICSMLSWRSTEAKRLYLSQCDVALANPKFANPTLMKLDPESQTADGSRDEFERYEWYVAQLVFVLDECLRLSPTDEWRAVVDTQLAIHARYFRSSYYRGRGHMGHCRAPIRELIAKVREA